MGNSNRSHEGMTQELQVLLSHESKEWGTPEFYVHKVQMVFGDGIDLDPASCAAANEWVGARIYYSKENDGLSQPWFGRVFLNPPYSKTGGKSNQEIWAAKLVAEYEAGNVKEAILLTKASIGYKWFKNLWLIYPCCLCHDLISFIDLDHPDNPPRPAKLGSAFFYLGPNEERFRDYFETIGIVT